ncbi:hypothetical protein U1Q18_021197 [Sarracenia purpurea var. burkii]
MSLAIPTHFSSHQIDRYGAVHLAGLLLLDNLHEFHLSAQLGLARQVQDTGVYFTSQVVIAGELIGADVDGDVEFPGLTSLGAPVLDRGTANRGAAVEDGHRAVVVLELAEVCVLDGELGRQPRVERRRCGGVAGANVVDGDGPKPDFRAFEAQHRKG